MQSSSNETNKLARVLALRKCERDTGAHSVSLHCAQGSEDPGTPHPTAMLWGRLTNSSQGWQIHREVSVTALGNIEAPLDCRHTWQPACDDIADQDLEGSEDADTSAELLRKRPDPFALSWKTKLEATTGDQTGTLRRISIEDGSVPPPRQAAEVPRRRVVIRSRAFHDRGAGILRRDRLGRPPGEIWTDRYPSHGPDDRPGD